MNYSKKLELFYNNKVVDWHEHVWADSKDNLNEADMDLLVENSYKTGIDILVVSLPVTYGISDPTRFRHCNNLVIQAMRKYPKEIRGMCYVNPGYTKESCEEIERCVKQYGMVGVKLYNQYFISDPIVYPVIEKCIELDIPILEHAGKVTSLPVTEPYISDGTHFAQVAARYPEAHFVYAHITGGGDYHWSLKAMSESPNVSLDISGSIYDEGVIEESVRKMGVERVMFGTDGSFSSSIGKLLGAKISDKDKIAILNNKKMERYL